MVDSVSNWVEQHGDETAKMLCVAFSSHGTPEKAFEFRGQLIPTGARLLLVNTPHKDCFLGGIPGLGDTLEETISAIKDVAGDATIVTVGAGVGGYAATLYGILLGAKRVLSFSPFLTLDTPLSPAARICGSEIEDAEHGNLLELIAENSKTHFTYFAPEWDIYQMNWLAQAGANKHVDVFGMLNIDTGVQKSYANDPAFSRLFERLFAPRRSRLTLPDTGGLLQTRDLCEKLYVAKLAAMDSDWEKARPLLEEIVETDPDCEAAQEQLGVLASTDRDFESAVSRFATCCELNSARSIYRDRLTKALRSSGSQDAALWELGGVDLVSQQESAKHKAQSLMTAGEYAQAFDLFEEAIASEPENLGLHQEYAICLMRGGRLIEAGRVMRKVVDEDASNPTYLHNLGVILLKMGDATRASTYLETAYNAQSGNPGFAHQYALSLHLLGRSEEAIEPLSNAVHARPDNQGFLALLVEVALKGGETKLAVKVARQLVTMSDMNPHYRFLLAQALEAQGDGDETVNQLRQALTLDMGNPDYAEALANILDKRGATAEARAVRQSARKVKRGLFG